MPKMLGLTYYNIKMLKNDFFSSLARGEMSEGQRGGSGSGELLNRGWEDS